jgi:uncharacterized protein
MRKLLAPTGLALAVLAILPVLARAASPALATPTIPQPTGFVTDQAGVLSADATARLTGLLRELQTKTGAEIAVLTVDTTAPLDDFTYAMRVAEAWKPGRARDDTGLLFLVAVRDRRLRVVTGYGLEGILPDGLVGQIQDKEIIPRFRAGDLAGGIEAGVRALAAQIAAEPGVTPTGVRPGQRDRAARPLPPLVLALLLLLLAAVFVYVASQQPRLRSRRRRGAYIPGDFGGGFGGSFGGGGGGFGGFGGGGFGGGGAGRSW